MKNRKRGEFSVIIVFLEGAIIIVLSVLLNSCSDHRSSNWGSYDGNNFRNHYSPLTQIDSQNVSHLKVAWVFHSGGADTINNSTEIECNPLEISGVLYGVSANTQAFAIDAATGKKLWETTLKDNGHGVTRSRGLAFWVKGKDRRLFFGAGKWVYALDPQNGSLIKSFGEHGRLNLKIGLMRPGADNFISENTPGTIYKNLLITSVTVGEGPSALLADVRAFNVKTGKLVWTFHTIPLPGEPGYSTWSPPNPRQHIGSANSWAGMSLDSRLGIVYVPTGSASSDFWGGTRKGDDLYANCLLALNAKTGRLLWYHQLVHHDIWDRDLVAPPNLLTINRNGKEIKVVAQVMKQGFLFVFNRINGDPIFPIEEEAVPQDFAIGDSGSSTQPIPLSPKPFDRQSFTEKDFSPFVTNRDSLINALRNMRTGRQYIPVTEKTTIIYPGTDGGADWGGAGTDPEGIIYIPSKEIPVYTRLVLNTETAAKEVTGKILYEMNCSSCHGQNREGSGDGTFPSLIGLASRMNSNEISTLIKNGNGLMPSFSSRISDTERVAIIHFLLGEAQLKVPVKVQNTFGVPFHHTALTRWYENGYPVSLPPWGTLTAINLNTGNLLWKVPLGIYTSLIKKGMPPTGTDNYGGPLITAGGLVIMAGTRDQMIRIFSKITGRLLWKHTLPSAGYATPCSYSVDGKQYVVIACGGGKLGTPSGDSYVAFALP